MTDIDLSLVKSFAPVRSDDGHKGVFGQALICAGSDFMTGAQVLCTGAALRSGAGLVRVFAPEGSLMPVRLSCPCALTSAYKDSATATLKLASELMKKTRSVAFGPGVDTTDKRNQALAELFAKSAPSLVFDASALTLLAKGKDNLLPILKEREVPAVLTPHIAEFKRLLGIEGQDVPSDTLRTMSSEYARDNNVIVVLKDSVTQISSPAGDCYIMDRKNSGMAKGGSGDVLTGLVAGFLAQGIDPLKAAVAAVWFHSKSGELAAESIGKRAMLPSDLEEFLPDGFAEAGW